MTLTNTVWYLEKNDFDEVDAAWCDAFNIKTLVYPLFFMNERVGTSIKLFTENDDQVAMLKFKYDYRLIQTHLNV